MIAGKDRDRDALEPRQFAGLPAREPDRQLFETAEASRRLCQVLLPEGGGLRCSLVTPWQVATEGADVV